jgi:hypothetical protein
MTVAVHRKASPALRDQCCQGCCLRGGVGYVARGHKSYRDVETRLECLRCGRWWKTVEGRRDSYWHNYWHEVGAREQVRRDRRKMRRQSDYVPFLRKFWQAIT